MEKIEPTETGKINYEEILFCILFYFSYKKVEVKPTLEVLTFDVPWVGLESERHQGDVVKRQHYRTSR